MMEEKWKIPGAAKLLVAIIGLSIAAVSVIGFAGKGFDTRIVLDQFALYGVIAIAAALILGSSFWLIVRKDKAEYFETLHFSSPENGILPIFKNYSGLKIFFLFFLIFSLLGPLIILKQIQFTGVPTLVEQQFTKGGELLYNLFLIPGSENLMVQAIIGLLILFILFPLASKYKWSKPNYQIILGFVFVLGFGFLGLANHLLRYSAEEGSKLVVFGFWAFGGLITVITGSFIPFWTFHIVNNLFLSIKGIASNDIILTGVVIGEIILWGLFFLIFGGKNKGVKEYGGIKTST